jgi:hypothetical protein
MWKKVSFLIIFMCIMSKAEAVVVENTFFDTLFPQTPYTQVYNTALELWHSIKNQKIADEQLITKKMVFLSALIFTMGDRIFRTVSKKHALCLYDCTLCILQLRPRAP